MNSRVDQLEDELHLWLLHLETPVDSAEVEAGLQLLDASERARHKRYIRGEDRDLFVRSHVFLRETLSRYDDRPPADWRFTAGEYGRPEIANAGVPTGLRCNLSHTLGLVAVLIHDHHDAGVDVERMGRVDDLVSVASVSFTPAERAQLDERANPDEADKNFTQLWTLKESFIKARGSGLHLSLQSFWFDATDPAAPTFDCLPAVDARPTDWRYHLSMPTRTHVVAVASHEPHRTSPRPVVVQSAAGQFGGDRSPL